MSKKINSVVIPMVFIIGLSVIAIMSCGKESKNASNFDRKAFLEYYADTMILPRLTSLKDMSSFLNGGCQSLNTNHTALQKELLKVQWKSAYNLWIYSNSFNFGPGGENGPKQSMVEEIAIWPVNVDKMNSFVFNGDTTFNNFDRDTRGFLAMEYILFKANTSDVQVINYLHALSRQIDNHISLVLSTWQASYKATFVAKTGVDVGSSTAMMYNEFVKSYENLKNFKLGLPMGKRVGQTKAEPEKVEALYSGTSFLQLKTHYLSFKDLYFGTSPSGKDHPTLSWKGYLNSVEGGPALVSATEAQFALIDAAFAAIPDEAILQEMIIAKDPRLEVLYTELQKMVRYIKSDMSSLLGIAITFASGDGD